MSADGRWAGRSPKKDEVRASVWADLITQGVAVGPTVSTIPNFVGADMAAWQREIAKGCQLVLIESPANPLLDGVDIAAVAKLCKAAGALLVVDNVFATPVLQRPLELGADVVAYSATKQIGRAHV